MMKLEELERERDNEKMTLVSGVPKVNGIYGIVPNFRD